MAHLPEDQEVSLGILSPKHLDLINECALRWRVGAPYRVACFMDIIKYKYEREEVPLECIPEALQLIAKTTHDIELGHWPRQDVSVHILSFWNFFDTLADGISWNAVCRFIRHLPLAHFPYHGKAAYNQIFGNRGLLNSSGNVKRQWFAGEVRARPGLSYHCHQGPGEGYCRSRIHGKTQRALLSTRSQQGITLFVHDRSHRKGCEDAGQTIPRTYPWVSTTEIFFRYVIRDSYVDISQIDLVPLMLESQVPLFLSDLESDRKRLQESSMNGPTPDIPIEDLFKLFHRTKTIIEMFHAFCPESVLYASLRRHDVLTVFRLPLAFDIIDFFHPYVARWLQTTDAKTAQWVENVRLQTEIRFFKSLINLNYQGNCS